MKTILTILIVGAMLTMIMLAAVDFNPPRIYYGYDDYGDALECTTDTECLDLNPHIEGDGGP